MTVKVEIHIGLVLSEMQSNRKLSQMCMVFKFTIHSYLVSCCFYNSYNGKSQLVDSENTEDVFLSFADNTFLPPLPIQ